jgi:protein phosphatase
VLRTRAIAKSDIGRQRTQNEDACHIDDALQLYLVCDGMGGHAAGQVAAELALETMVHTVHRRLRDAGAPGAGSDEPLIEAMHAANQAVRSRSLEDPSCRGMGTTAVGARIAGADLHIAHVGDSRLYLLRDGILQQLTRDHSLSNLYEEHPELAGQLGPPSTHLIVRAIGLDEALEVDHRTISLRRDDLILLCSDGLSDLVDELSLRELLLASSDLAGRVDALIARANANGGTDNVTVVLVAVEDGGAGVPPQSRRRSTARGY